MIAELAHELLPYLAALYAFDGMVLVRRGERLLAAPPGGRALWREPGWHPAALLPGAEVFLTDAAAVRVSAEEAWLSQDGEDALAKAPADLSRVAFPSLEDCASDDKAIVAGGRVVGKAPSPVSARRAAELLRALAALPARKRVEAFAQRLAAEVDPAPIRARRAHQRRFARTLAGLGTLLFATVFVALPVAVYGEGRQAAATPLVGLAALLWAAILSFSTRSLRAAGRARGETALALAPAIFFPLAAAHVGSVVWRDAFRDWPPLAVAAVLMDAEELGRLARRYRGRLEEARARDAGGPLEADVAARAAAFRALVASAGIDARALSLAPRDAGAASFCPLCETEYRSGFATCTDCGAALRPFAASAGPSGPPAPR